MVPGAAAMAGDSLGEVGEGGVDLVAVAVPVAVAARVEVARRRGAGEGKLFHAPLDRCPPGDGFVGRDRWKHGDAHGLVGAQGGSEGVLPDTMAARDDDREERAPEAAREGEGSRLERDLDAEDGALREEEDAIPGRDGGTGLALERAGGMDRTLGADEEVPSARELAAEEREGGELVAGDGGEREGEMEEGEAVGEALMEGGDHVSLLRVDVFETADADAQTDEAGGDSEPTSARRPGRPPGGG